MKRHESMAVFSREHHFGLLFCWKIRQGVKKQVPAQRMGLYVKYFRDNHLEMHFQEEESLLFTALEDSLVEQALSEHTQIRQLEAAIIGKEHISPDQINMLADALDNHIRFEERILFPYLEQSLPDNILTGLGKQLQQSHQSGEKDDYPDEFWI